MTGDGLQELAVRCPFITRSVEVGWRTWEITAVQDQDALLDSVRTDEDLAAFPYGLLLWASAIGLARRLAEEPALVRGKRVLEIGCGVGLPGIVARWLGADVDQSDYQMGALELARRNAERNGIDGIRRFRGDWRAFPDRGGFDLVLGSDVLYERALHERVLALLPRLIAPGGQIILSDPIRPVAIEFVDRMERDGWRVEMESLKVEWEGDRREIAIFAATR